MFPKKLNLIIACILIKLTVASEICNSSAVPARQQTLDETFKRTSPLYGLSTISDEHLIKQQCHKHLQFFQNGLRQKLPWALKMYDASASLESGFTFGNNFWLGNIEVCHAVAQPVNFQVSSYLPHQMKAELLTSFAPFPVEFRVLYFRHNSSWQVDPIVTAFATRIHMGLCVPSSCTEQEIRGLMETYLSSDLFAGNELYDMNLQYDYAKDLKLKPDTFRRTSFYLCCVFITATVGLTIAAAMLKTTTVIEEINIGKSSDEAQKATEISTANNKASENQQFVVASSFIACYDIQTNCQHIFKPSKASNTFAALNGIRFASAIGVTMYHYLMFLFNGTRNKLTLFGYLVHIGNVDVFVDVFFTISGFLQAYHHFRNVVVLEIIRKNNFKQNIILIGLHLFHRYLRLAPLYFLTIGVLDFSAKLMDDISLFDIDHKPHLNCENYWWRNVFFIQNFFNHNDMCCLWTWSLACDMQFSVLATVLLFLYVKHPKRTKLCLAVLVVASIGYTYNYGLKLNFDGTLESTFASLTEIYIHPLARILAYISGSIAGWYFVQQKQLPFTMGKRTQQFMLYLVLFIFIGCVFKPRVSTFSVFTSTSILLLERIVFTITLSIVFVASGYGHIRWFFGFYESVFYQKFSRVAYAMFLLNPTLTFALPAYGRSNLYANPLQMCVELIGVLVALVLYSTVITLLFEVPYQNLSRLLIIRQIKKKIS
ncbi:nose resistant to fluoxetine protein 6-like [Zeugodacus cucurbitae]|uniref:nose resistant to fluoxetine protein 6-like n=1 Tax=Zeugodacus cucurbitae TaxID=28588 RepID=UPI00059694F4|nr:nose resistant to fluoxetine protein 6-like [Zeugodacus cucurbitae]